MTESNDERLMAHLEPGERLLWAGRPDASLLISARRRRRLAGLGFVAVILIGLGAWMWPDAVRLGERPGLPFRPEFLLAGGLGGLFGLFAVGGLPPASRHARYCRGLAYGITDRRLLIVDGEALEGAFRPDEVAYLERIDRGGRHGDLIWARRRPAGRRGSGVSPLEHERRVVGFKALRDPGGVAERIERWRHDRRSTAASALRDSLARIGHGGGRTVVHPRHGFRLTLPRDWAARLRETTRPPGRFRVLASGERGPDDPQWNVLEATGPARLALTLEVHETAPTLTLEGQLEDPVTRRLGLAPVSHEARVELGGLVGHSVTWRPHDARFVPGDALRAEELVRRIVLHDGRLQYVFELRWPEPSRELAELLARVAGTFEPAGRGGPAVGAHAASECSGSGSGA